MDIRAVAWSKQYMSAYGYRFQSVSTNFTVIGEIFVPESWRRDDELRNNCKELAISEDLTNTL